MGRMLPKHQWYQLLRLQGGRCAYCGPTSARLERDHIVPLSRGGSDDFDNSQILCAPCNTRKGTLTDWEFRWLYQRLLPEDGGIPDTHIPSEWFTSETEEINWHYGSRERALAIRAPIEAVEVVPPKVVESRRPRTRRVVPPEVVEGADSKRIDWEAVWGCAAMIVFGFLVIMFLAWVCGP